MYGIDDFVEYAVLVIQVTGGLFFISVAIIYLPNRWGAPWIITSPRKIKRMLDLVELKPGERLIDLGAGDGRIVIAAVKEYGAVATGVEIDPLKFLLAKIFIRWNRVRGMADVQWGNIFETSLNDVNVIALYLTRETNSLLRPYLENNCDPGTRIVSNAFSIPGWTPIIIDDLNLIFVYEIGNTGDEVVINFV